MALDAVPDVVPSEPMPDKTLALNFHVENRAGVMVLVHENGDVRPATVAEVDLWNIVTKRFSSTRESYVRVSEQDLLELLRERDHMRTQVTGLQARGTELVEANRALKKALADADLSSDSSTSPSG